MLRINQFPEAGCSFDDSNGAVRSIFNPGAIGPATDENQPAVGISDDFLAANSDLFKLDGISLTFAVEKEGSSQTTCKYGQYHNGIPVYGAYVNVTMSKSDSEVLSSVNRILYGIPPDLGLNRDGISSENALVLTAAKYDPQGKGMAHSEPRLYIYREYLVWRIEIDLTEPEGYRELMVDAATGNLVGDFDRRRFISRRKCMIFWPDPVTSSQNPDLHWGSPEELLDKELVEAELDNLDDQEGPEFYLCGKWVRIAELEDPEVAGGAMGNHLIFSSKDRNLLSTMAYYYIDRLVEWIRSLGIRAFNEAMTGPVGVDAQAADGADNSHFVVPVSGEAYIGFGEGGTPDASDPGVIVHEFGHALHYFLLGRLNPPGPFEEGFNDFLSCVFRDRFNVHQFDRANPFPWDNNSTVSWDSTRRCDTSLRFDDPMYESFGFYLKGTLYATALWEIFLEMGGKSKNAGKRRLAADAITGTCLDMLIAIGDTGPIMDLVNGLISSDKNRTGGRHEKVIRSAFDRRGCFR